MRKERKIIWIFVECTLKEILQIRTPNISKMYEKGTVLSHILSQGNMKKEAGAAGTENETIWELARNEGLLVAPYTEPFDLCVMELKTCVDLESELNTIMKNPPRYTIICINAMDSAIIYGSGIARAKRIDTPFPAGAIGSSLAYIANFPMPEDCEAPIIFPVLRDINRRFREYAKLHTLIDSTLHLLDRNVRPAWIKHGCP